MVINENNYNKVIAAINDDYESDNANNLMDEFCTEVESWLGQTEIDALEDACHKATHQEIVTHYWSAFQRSMI